MSVSEWSMPVERGGVKTEIGEYSISVVGPGPRRQQQIGNSLERPGVRTMAKTQFNNTWEISAVPYIPVPHLIARHCTNLTRAGDHRYSGFMDPGRLSIAQPGSCKRVLLCPGLNRQTPCCFASQNAATASRRGAGQIVESSATFSKAFELYPYSVAIYTIPDAARSCEPAALEADRALRNSMILFPQDDYKSWSGKYPPRSSPAGVHKDGGSVGAGFGSIPQSD